MRRWLVALLLVLSCVWGRSALAAEAHKVAIIVGANLAPPGRVPLRYAHEDARRVNEVLLAVAGFNARDTQLLLDPNPAEVLASLDRELRAAALRTEETVLFFYYSGHADEASIFPAGQPLSFSELKKRLEDTRVKLRIGLIDSCRGGSWTGTKGLKKVEPFVIDTPPTLLEEGSVLIASSSGHESAHETEALQGSFFTHYWNAGLRGAADRGGDGVITLNEAFEYARSLTIRDTALIGQEPQHPSFQMRLSGRRDVPLATLARQRTTLVYDQLTGPTEVVRLSDGLVVVETTPGARRVRLGLAAGTYLLRRRTQNAVFARITTLSAGSTLVVGEPELERSVTAGRAKGLDGVIEVGNSWSSQHLFLSASIGVRHAPVIDPGLRLSAPDGDAVALARASVRLTRHLWWSAPLGLVFDAERTSAFNWFVWAGDPVLSISRRNSGDYAVAGFLGAGIDARYTLSERHTLNASLSELTDFELGHHSFDTLLSQLTIGLSETVPDTVTFNLGVGVAANLATAAPADSSERNLTLAFGSAQRAGLRPLPLVHVPLGLGWGIDVHAVGAYLPAKKGWVETYLAGISYVH